MRKRLFDIIFSLFGLSILTPIFFVFGLAIKLTSSGPVFFRGERIGKDGNPFRIYKFRTMVVGAEKMGASSTAEDDPRITHVGRFLRKYKLDELPQLLNVFKGEMSIVGPRPQVPWIAEQYSGEEKLLFSVKPGMTDWASIEFSNEGEILKGSEDPDRDYLEKIAPRKRQLGLEYVRNHSLWTDLKIIFLTIKRIFL